MSVDIGKKIKELRTDKGLTLKELSSLTDLSIGFLSQLERGLTTIAVDTLENIANVFQVELTYFFSIPKKTNKYVLREYEKEILTIKETGFIDYSLSNNLFEMSMMPRLIKVLPRKFDENIEMYQHQGEEFIYVLEGILTLYIDGEQHDLNPGDCAHINSTIQHNWANYTNKVVKLLTINTPNTFKEKID